MILFKKIILGLLTAYTVPPVSYAAANGLLRGKSCGAKSSTVQSRRNTAAKKPSVFVL